MTSLPLGTEGTKAVLSQGIRDVSRKGTFVHGHSRDVVGSAVHVYSSFRSGGFGVCMRPGGGGVWWVCLRGFEQPVGGKRRVCSEVEEAGWGAGFWSV